jgi:ATP-dependent helicase/nuclease subunit A
MHDDLASTGDLKQIQFSIITLVIVYRNEKTTVKGWNSLKLRYNLKMTKPLISQPIPDAHERQLALEVTRSFIVQAPAGSGKTELLTRRYIQLLTHAVQEPEEIVAITFTRKAAIEMRQRILSAISIAETATQEKIGYLLDNPNRLRIMTIDAWCLQLVQQMPLRAKLSPSLTLTDNADTLYQQAIVQLLLQQHDQKAQQALGNLLLHLDNDVARLSDLLVDILRHRDQWLPHVYRIDLIHELENGLSNVLIEHQQKLWQLLPASCHSDFHSLIKQWGLTDLAQALLTEKGEWRKRITGHDEPHKTQLKSLLQSLYGNETLREVLNDALYLPPKTYSNTQKAVLNSLAMLLPILVAELHLLFVEHQQCDFIEIALRALQALGEEESPTDLALYLDYQIKHLLVDEFQDTSVTQLKLLKKLTTGWQAGDGRTLFFVGDPMQSIYRFRKAEVGLFLQVQQQGLNHIYLEPVTLIANFRANENLVMWFNQQFQQIFPQQSDIGLGAITYTPSQALPGPSPAQTVFHYSCDDTNEAATVIGILQQIWRDDPQAHVSILVRARSHLFDIIPVLQQQQIKYRAVELMSLRDHPLVQDLYALTRALCNVADRIAWLAILRAPWCGLTLKDLHALVSHDHHTAVWDLILRSDLTSMSEEGRKRLQFFIAVMLKSLSQRGRVSLREWVETTWLALRGPSCFQDPYHLQVANLYFDLLNRFECDADSSAVEQQLGRLATPANTDPDIRLDIMTIHKAKGLEFDAVILLGLAKATRQNASSLFLWTERINARGEADLLVAPIKSAAEKEDDIYSYLKYEEAKRSRYELQRLLYVAATRAKKSLHLLLPTPETRIDKHSFAAML